MFDINPGWFVTAHEDSVIRLWHIQARDKDKGSETIRFQPIQLSSVRSTLPVGRPIRAVDLSPDLKWTVAASDTGVVGIKQLIKNISSYLLRPDGQDIVFTFLLFSPDRTLLAYGGDRGVCEIMQVDSHGHWTLRQKLVGHDTGKKILNAHFHPKSQHLVTCSGGWNRPDLGRLDRAVALHHDE